MAKCLNCNKELEITDNRRPKLYCNASCRQKHWQNSKEKKFKLISIEHWNELQEQLNNIAKDLNKQTNKVEPKETPKTNYTIDTRKVTGYEKYTTEQLEEEKSKHEEEISKLGGGSLAIQRKKQLNGWIEKINWEIYYRK